MCDLSGGATPHGRNRYIQQKEEIEDREEDVARIK